MAFGKFEGFKPAELVLSAAALVAIFLFLDARRLLSIIAGADIWLFAAACAAYFCTVLLMTYRIRYVLGRMHEKIGYVESFKANWGGLLASDFTPARTGYFVTPLLLRTNAGIPLEKGMATVVIPQIPEFFFKAVGASAGILLLLASAPNLQNGSDFLWLGVLVMLFFCVAMWIVLFVPRAVEIARGFGFLPLVREICDFVSQIQANRMKVKEAFPRVVLISVAIFILKGIEWYLFGASLGIEFSSVALPPIVIFMVLQPLVTIFQFAPFPTAAGLGLAEGSAAVAMALLGIPAELAVAYALLIRGGTVLVNAGGIFQLVPYILRRKKRKEEVP
ncbi:MAG: flippase-like domain-containing protein [Candidatus Micrarchaeota archaeon]|nr:flippase-like domain-containing protein [Candidatus Micrarchaeota archaeon]